MTKRDLAIITGVAAFTVLIGTLLIALVVRPSRSIQNPASNANAAGSLQSDLAVGYPTPIVYPMPVLDRPIVSAVNGYTVTLYAGYANANRVVLRYTLQSAFLEFCNVEPYETLPGQEPPYQSSAPAVWPATPLPLPTREYVEPQLTTSDGRIFREALDANVAGSENPAGDTMVFDTPHPPENLPTELKLHLAIDYAGFRIPLENGGAIHNGVKGPFAFDFTLPVDSVRRIADVNQTTATSRGHDVTVETVIATRHDVRVTWRVEKSAEVLPTATSPYLWRTDYACCELRLGVGGEEATFRETSFQREGGLAITDIAVIDVQGEWTISAWYYSTIIRSMYDPPIPGPVFRFTMPPATTSLQQQTRGRLRVPSPFACSDSGARQCSTMTWRERLRTV